MQYRVIRPKLAGHKNAGELIKEIPMGQHNAFRTRLGTARIKNLGQVIVINVGPIFVTIV